MRAYFKALSAWLTSIHSEAYCRAKGAYLGNFSVTATLITALFVGSTWIWDAAIDPVGMRDVFWLRGLETLSLLILAAIMRPDPTGWPARIGLFIVPAFVQVTFIDILDQLEGGLSYGMGGFIYFFLFVPFMAQAQTLRFNAVLLAFIAALPNLLVIVGFNHPLNLGVYNAYVWMAYGPVVLMLALIEYLIHQVHSQHGQLKRYADSDPLTGLTNRRTFLDQGRDLLRSSQTLGRPVSVLFADLDHFKALNDRHGHGVGDAALQAVAERLTHCVRSTDLVARFGGEEFVMLLPDLDSEGAARVAEEVCRQVAEEPVASREANQVGPYLTVSVGHATAEPAEKQTDIEELIRLADNAVYRAKSDGRNRAIAATAVDAELPESESG